MTKVAHIKNRTVIAVGGGDAADFLQGLITNDIYKTTEDKAIYACFLTPQGKFLFDMFILKDGERYLLDVEAGRHKEFLMRLTMFKLRADVTLEDLSDRMDVYAAWNGDVKGGYQDPRLPELGQRFILPKGQKPDSDTVDFEVYDHFRITHGAPDGARDMIPERSAMLECNMDTLNALDWDKGCYMGQELTARTHYRGLVKRRLMPFSYSGDAPGFGSFITNDAGEKIGEVRSTCNGVGLALVKVEQAKKVIEKGSLVMADEKNLKLVGSK